MRPFRTGVPLSSWLLRISLVSFLFLKYLHVVQSLNFKCFEFYVAALLLVFSVLLFIGGLIDRTSLTVFSAFIIFIISVYKTIAAFNGDITNQVITLFIITSIAFHFLCKGNKS